MCFVPVLLSYSNFWRSKMSWNKCLFQFQKLENVWITYRKFSKLLMNCMENLRRSMHPLCTMATRNRRIFDLDSQSDDSQSYGYGGGGDVCPQINAALHRVKCWGSSFPSTNRSPSRSRMLLKIPVNSPWENLNVS